MVALPGQLFYGSQIPVCLWFVARDRSGAPTRGGKQLRSRKGEVQLRPDTDFDGFEPIVLRAGDDDVRVVAEVVDVLPGRPV